MMRAFLFLAAAMIAAGPAPALAKHHWHYWQWRAYGYRYAPSYTPYYTPYYAVPRQTETAEEPHTADLPATTAFGSTQLDADATTSSVPDPVTPKAQPRRPTIQWVNPDRTAR